MEEQDNKVDVKVENTVAEVSASAEAVAINVESPSTDNEAAPVNNLTPPPTLDSAKDGGDGSESKEQEFPEPVQNDENKGEVKVAPDYSMTSEDSADALDNEEQEPNEESTPPPDEGMQQPTEAPVEAPAPTIEPTAQPQLQTTKPIVHSQMVSGDKPHEHRNNKKLAVLVTLLVAVILAGIMVYIYVSTTDNTRKTTAQSSQSQSTSDSATTQANSNTSTAATVSDVNQVTTDLDAALQALNDTSDFSDTSLTDQTLGL